ncbi:MAG: metallophosphoesterase [Polyangiaceae bacterium]
MRNTLIFAAIVSAAACYLACGSQGGSGASGSGDDGGGSTSSSGGGSSGGSSSGTSSSSGSGGSSSGTSSGASSSGSGGSSSGCTANTGPITGSVGASGGSISRLVFGVVGDTRPTNEDDPSGYPSSIISTIFSDLQAQSPRPPLVVATGDYQFSSTGSNSTATQQVDLYMQARAGYSGSFFPAMGNHECGVSGGFTTSDNNNCGPGNQGGATPNYNAFIKQMLAPISQTKPYYSINVNATDGSWTAKFVVTAANAWDTAQQTWLESTLAQKTTYTFVIRHEASDSYPPLPPGVAGVDAALANAPYTLLIVGHAHTYGHYSSTPKSVTIGNGGAPITASNKDYGYAVFSQRCDGAIVADEYDYKTNATDSYFHFVITPDGTITK